MASSAAADIDSHRSPDSGGSHVPCAARPQRQRHRRGGRVLQQAVRHRPGQAPARLRQLRHQPSRRSSWSCWKTPARAAASTTSASRSPTPAPWTPMQARLTAAGLASADERDTTCCYARQDKFWVQGAPDGEVVGDLHRPGRQPDLLRPGPRRPRLLRRRRRPRRRVGRVRGCVLLNRGRHQARRVTSARSAHPRAERGHRRQGRSPAARLIVSLLPAGQEAGSATPPAFPGPIDRLAADRLAVAQELADLLDRPDGRVASGGGWDDGRPSAGTARYWMRSDPAGRAAGEPR